jgi:uncharacterized protein (TIGR02266 family)
LSLASRGSGFHRAPQAALAATPAARSGAADPDVRLADDPPRSLVSSARPSGVRAAFERRAGARLSVDLDVSIGSDDHFFTATASDLSSGGLFIETYRALAVGCELSIEFDVPAGRFVGRGVVAWARESDGRAAPGYGIRFVELSRYARPLLEGFCRHLSGVPSSRLLAG